MKKIFFSLYDKYDTAEGREYIILSIAFLLLGISPILAFYILHSEILYFGLSVIFFVFVTYRAKHAISARDG